jgi:N utilization substance protein B
MPEPDSSLLLVRERRLAREEAFKLVFQADQGVTALVEILDVESAETTLAPATWAFARELADGAWQRRAEVDPLLDELASGWTLDRMASADRAVLRLGAYEVLFREDIPVGVSINEAVELAKRYGTDDSPRFVNGILGAIARRRTEQP